VNSVRRIPLFPQLGNTASAVTVSASVSTAGVVSGETSASTLTLRPVAAGSTTVTVRVVDTNNNAVETSFPVTVVTAPVITTQPANQTIPAADGSTMSVAATAGSSFQWQYNGATLADSSASIVNITNMQPSLAGLYNALVTNNGATIASRPAIVGVSALTKVLAGASEIGPNIKHPNGNTFDQVLLQASSSAFTADWQVGDVTRLSYIDLQDDIVQVEYSGPGTVSIILDAPSGPAAPTKYNQADVSYMKGHATIVVTGADERSNLSVFSVGRANAFDPTGAYNFLQPISATNNPENNGSSLFTGHATSTYDGFADLARICIISNNGKFGGLRAANARFYDVKGYTGIYAPGVVFQGPVFVGDIAAYSEAKPAIVLGSADDTRVTGGDLFQPNGQPVEIFGITQLKFTAGGTSGGGTVAAHVNEGILHKDGANVTTQVVVNPQ
jgi:hypothetical protein